MTNPSDLSRAIATIVEQCASTSPDHTRADLPVWIRIPSASEREPYTGLTRSVLYRLIREGRIESKVIRQEGKPTGVRLIRLKSLLDFIDSVEQDGSEMPA